MAKPAKKRQARLYRQEGKSIVWIARELEVAKSSVSRWTRDIVLTEAQEIALRHSNERRVAQQKGAEANVRKHRQKRLAYQAEGRAKARTGHPLHLAGCMLYWAEGYKSRNEVKFVNSDAEMIRTFMRFLRCSLNVHDDEIKLRIVAYLDNDLSKNTIEAHWLAITQLSRSHLGTCSYDNAPISSQQRGRKLTYGVCEVIIYNTRYIQHIYGAIQAYMNFERPTWLD